MAMQSLGFLPLTMSFGRSLVVYHSLPLRHAPTTCTHATAQRPTWGGGGGGTREDKAKNTEKKKEGEAGEDRRAVKIPGELDR